MNADVRKRECDKGHDPKQCDRARRGMVHTANPEGGKSYARLVWDSGNGTAKAVTA